MSREVAEGAVILTNLGGLKALAGVEGSGVDVQFFEGKKVLVAGSRSW